VLSNPLSGGNRRGLTDVRRVLGEHRGLPHHEVETPAGVAFALADFARQGVQVVAVNGGDGTVQATLTALFRESVFESPPRLAVLPAGTTSMIAGDVGLRGGPPRALARLLAWARSPGPHGAVVERSVLSVEPSPGTPPLFGMFFGTAAIYQGIQFWRARIHRLGVPGELGVGLAAARLLVALAQGRADLVSPVPVTAVVDGNGAERRDHLLLLVTTLERLLLGLRPYWGDGAAPLRYTAVTGRPRRLLAALAAAVRGRRSRHATPENGYVSRNVREVRLWLDGGYTLDGELFTAESARGPIVLREAGRAAFVRC
jgi:hypothetical protein